MEEKDFLEKVTLLLGVSYTDWKKISLVVSTVFEQKKKEHERQLILDSKNDIQKVIQSLFG